MSEGNSSRRVLRGGSWGGHAHSLRSASRLRDVPDSRIGIIGFRVAASAR
ncbi:MAG: SUMF1/EgtB/PvdO family nonheme iron enzyme [Pyrinomonadaceae bacterium]